MALPALADGVEVEFLTLVSFFVSFFVEDFDGVELIDCDCAVCDCACVSCVSSCLICDSTCLVWVCVCLFLLVLLVIQLVFLHVLLQFFFFQLLLPLSFVGLSLLPYLVVVS